MRNGKFLRLLSCFLLGLTLLACQFPPLNPFGNRSAEEGALESGQENGEGQSLVPDWASDLFHGQTDQTDQAEEPAAGGATNYAVGLSLVGQLGGSAMTIDLADDVAVMGQGPRVVTLDVSDPHSPQLLGESEVLDGLVMGIAVRDRLAYAVTMYGGLVILDVSNPARITQVSKLIPQLPGCSALTLEGDLAYVACNPGGLWIVDVSDPEKPETVFQNSPQNGACLSIAKQGDYAYMTDLTTLYVLNVQDPSAPIMEGSYTFPDLFPDVELGQGYLGSVRACGDELCLAAWLVGLATLDISDPVVPRVLDHLYSANVTGMVVDDNIIYAAEETVGIRVIDISDPSDLQEVNLLPISWGGWELTVMEQGERGMVIGDGSLFITDPSYGLTVVDITQPGSLTRIGSYMTPLPDIAFDVEVQGDLAFVASRTAGFRSVDISDPSQPRELDYDDSRKNGLLQNPSRLQLVGKYAYVSDSNFPFSIYDISDPANLREIGAVFDHSSPAGASDLAVNGDFVYLAGYGSKHALYPGYGIWVVDASQVANPAAVNFVDVANWNWRFALAKGYLYALDTQVDSDQAEPLSLRVFSLATPSQPREIFSLPLPELMALSRHALIVDEEEDRLYINMTSMGVLVIDISSPETPQRLAQIPIMSGAEDIQVNGHYLFTSGAMAYDISDLSVPSLAGTFSTLQSWDFAFQDDLVFVTPFFTGLYILKFEPQDLGPIQYINPTSQ